MHYFSNYIFIISDFSYIFLIILHLVICIHFHSFFNLNILLFFSYISPIIYLFVNLLNYWQGPTYFL